MILRERRHVNAPPERIWAILRDPRRMSDWNPHCVQCETREDEMRPGLHFQATMSFGHGPARDLDCHVIACEPQHLLTLRFSGAPVGGPDEYVDETYVLEPLAQGVRVVHAVDFTHSGLPWFLKVVLKLVSLVGQSRDKSPLEVLQELAEGTGG